MNHLKYNKYLASERSGLLRVAKLNTKKECFLKNPMSPGNEAGGHQSAKGGPGETPKAGTVIGLLTFLEALT